MCPNRAAQRSGNCCMACSKIVHLKPRYLPPKSKSLWSGFYAGLSLCHVCCHLMCLYAFYHEVQKKFSTLSRSQTDQVRRLPDFVPHTEMVVLRLTSDWARALRNTNPWECNRRDGRVWQMPIDIENASWHFFTTALFSGLFDLIVAVQWNTFWWSWTKHPLPLRAPKLKIWRCRHPKMRRSKVWFSNNETCK